MAGQRTSIADPPTPQGAVRYCFTLAAWFFGLAACALLPQLLVDPDMVRVLGLMAASLGAGALALAARQAWAALPNDTAGPMLWGWMVVASLGALAGLVSLFKAMGRLM